MTTANRDPGTFAARDPLATPPPGSATSDRELVATRVFDAPRELVFNAWTDPARVGQWWGPRGFTTTTYAMDVRPGGVWRFCMHGPDGRDYQNKITYREVVRPERLVYKHGDADPSEGLEPVSFEVTVNFEAQDSRTRVTMRMVFPSAKAREFVVKTYGAVEGGNQHVARLAEYLAKPGEKPRPALTLTLPSEYEIMLRRTFAAPRRLLFEAMTRPEHIKNWWGPRGTTLVTCEMDFRPGGAWRSVLRGLDGNDHPFKGIYREIVVPERVVRTFVYDVDVIRDHEAVETMTLVEEDGQTTLTSVTRHKSVEARDGHLNSGMEWGVVETYARLDELLATMDAASSTGEFVITRTFDAPREMVWKAWTEQERLAKWWGPKGFTFLSGTLDLRPGGLFHYGMRSPDGKEMWGKFVYREIVPQERLVFVVSFSDKNGGTSRHPMSATWPLEVLNTLTLTEQAGKTTLTIRGVPVNATEGERKTFAGAHESMQKGFAGTLDQLAEFLANR